MPGTRTLLCVFLLMLAIPAVAGNVYRWTDADGVVHYSDQPRTEADVSKVNPVTMKAQAQPESHNAAAEASGNKAKGEGSESADLSGEVAKVRAKRCRKAKKRLVMLQKSARVQVQKNGKTSTLKAEERVQAIVNSKKAVKKLCQ